MGAAVQKVPPTERGRELLALTLRKFGTIKAGASAAGISEQAFRHRIFAEELSRPDTKVTAKLVSAGFPRQLVA